MIASLSNVLIIDGIALLLLVICIFIGYKKGFIRTAVGLIGKLLVIVVALLISVPVAKGVYDNFVYDKIYSDLETNFDMPQEEEYKDDLDKAIENIPDYVNDIIKSYGYGSTEELYNEFSSSHNGDKDAVLDIVADKVARPIIQPLIGNILTLIMIIIGFILVRILSNLIGNVAENIIGIKTVDSILGVAFGMIQGVLVVFIFANVVVLLVRFGVLPTSLIDDSFIVSFVDSINPLNNFFDKSFKDLIGFMNIK